MEARCSSSTPEIELGGAAAFPQAPSMADTIVFVPAWNEEETLPAVLDELRAGLPFTDVLVVDDGSTDRTSELARAGGADLSGNRQDLLLGSDHQSALP